MEPAGEELSTMIVNRGKRRASRRAGAGVGCPLVTGGGGERDFFFLRGFRGKLSIECFLARFGNYRCSCLQPNFHAFSVDKFSRLNG